MILSSFVKQNIRDLLAFLSVQEFFLRGQASKNRPIQSDTEHQNESFDAVWFFDMRFGDRKTTTFEVKKQASILNADEERENLPQKFYSLSSFKNRA